MKCEPEHHLITSNITNRRHVLHNSRSNLIGKEGWFQGDSSPRHRFLRPRTELAACWPNESLSSPPPWCTPSWCCTCCSTCWTDRCSPLLKRPPSPTTTTTSTSTPCNVSQKFQPRPPRGRSTSKSTRHTEDAFLPTSIGMISARFFPWMDTITNRSLSELLIVYPKQKILLLGCFLLNHTFFEGFTKKNAAWRRKY